MAVTKVTDAMRNVVAVDATKLTGAVDVARLPSTVLNSNVPATDLTSVKQDIAMLALYNAVSDNRAAYNLPNSFIDQFEDDTGTTTRTDVANVDEYFGSVIAGGPAIDSYDKLILHSDSTDGNTTFTDSSDSGHTITANGNVNHSTDSPAGKFGSTSIHFDGTTDYLSLPSHADWTFGTGDFTLDFWYRSTDSGDRCIVGNSSTGSTSASVWRAKSDYRLKFGSSHTDNFTGSTSLSQSVFQHIAYTRASNSLRVFINGTQEGATTTVSTDFSDTRELWIGNAHDGGDLHGYVDEMRISKGIARWTADFTPPTGTYGSTTVNATGTLISDQQTAPALTKMSGVVLVKDGGSSTTVMGTHLKIYFCATGAAASFPSAWVEADSYTAVTAPFSTGVTMYKLGETTVPSGTLPTIRAVWASQTDGGYESQLHGWAMNY